MRPLRNPDATATLFWALALLLAAWVYVFGLDSPYAPSNGDELVYAHIARKTAETGHWLPLASELMDTRNTKPPLLFWQAMVAGEWGERWSLAALRTPSLIYLALVAAAIALGLRQLLGRWREGLLAATVFLAFLSTFRYGRTYLTSAPETFWFSLPLFALWWQRLRQPAASPGWTAHILLGLALGAGLLYKSYALVVPAAAAWWLALLASAPQPLRWANVRRHTLRVGMSAALALGLFALWLVLDPDPAGVWQEFVVAENAAKFRDPRSWWQAAVALDGSSLWSQLLAYGVNAGLLLPVVAGLAWLGLRQLPRLRAAWPLAPHTAILLAWAGVWLLVFLLPTQRSARYVIPAMPALAMLLALHWRAISRAWFVPALLLAAGALVLLTRIAWVGHALGLSSALEWALVLAAAGAGALAVLAGLWQPLWTRAAAVLTTLLVYATFNLTVAPLDGPLGRYPAATVAAAPAGPIAVPNGFNGQFERMQFLLPGKHRYVPYETGARRAHDSSWDPAAELAQLLARHAAVVWVQHDSDQTRPPCLPGCRVLGERWILTSRHLPGEVRLDNVWYPQQWLYRREWLIAPG
jgi:4-amino-4-deoxy-L-arabinose transferase-like glycosyltransferase